MPAARFELAAHVNVNINKPDSQQNKNPSPRQPGTRRDEIVTLTTDVRTSSDVRDTKGIQSCRHALPF